MLMDNLSELPYEIDVPAGQRPILLTPYDLVVTVNGEIRIEIGRFSLACLPRIRVHAIEESRILLRMGAFCEVANDAVILIGGEHRNSSLLNYSFGASCVGFRHLMTPEDRTLACVAPAVASEIGDNVTISTGAKVLGGAKIGAGTVIGAGAVVRKAEAYGIYGGIPAKRIRDRFPDPFLYEALRLPEVMARDVPRLPRLIHQLEAGEIGLSDYLSAVSFLPARPAIHIAANLTAEGEIVTERITGYSIGGKTIDDPRVHAYFGQIGGTGKMRWAPDIFEALQLY